MPIISYGTFCLYYKHHKRVYGLNFLRLGLINILSVVISATGSYAFKQIANLYNR